ncbi:MAG: ABC transporter permease [Rhodoferax sp.]|nr:ABC transporter permease [Rhodoferax sp.]
MSLLRAARPVRWNPVAALLAFIGVGAVAGLPFLRVAPNRLVSGEAVSLLRALHGPSWGLLVLLLAILLAPLWRPTRAVLWLQVVGAVALLAGLLGVAGIYASQVAQTESPLARTSLGGAFWTLLIVLWLTTVDALQRLQVGLAVRIAVLVTAVGLLLLPLLSGVCDALSIMKELANQSGVFGAAVLRHIAIVLAALAPTLCLGVPLGWWVCKSARGRQALFPVLNIIQTLPSIALFGLLMAPLAWLAAAYPALARAGISGVGMAPGVIALILYSLLPVVRGTLAGLEQVPAAVREAARGMGMSPAQIFYRVEVPLALPVLLAGVRTATNQAIGLAAVTALIGAGGLGAIMFEGLFSSAHDLVLLGVLPIVALAVLADTAFKLLINVTQGPSTGSQAGTPP